MARRSARAVDGRRYRRHRLSVPITLILNDHERPGFTKDIGEGGTLAFVSQPLQVGDKLVLRLDKIGNAPSISIMAAVRHSNGVEHGLEFTPLEQAL